MSHRSFVANTNRVAAPRQLNYVQTPAHLEAEIGAESNPDAESHVAADIKHTDTEIDASTSLSSTCSEVVATLANLENLALHQLHANNVTALRLAQQQCLKEAQEAYLKAKLDSEIVQKAKPVRGKYFGWEGVTEKWCERTDRRLVGNASGIDEWDGHILLKDKWGWVEETSDDKWRVLKDVEAHRFLLEDPVVKEQFFDDLEKLWLRNDLRGLPSVQNLVNGTGMPIPGQRKVGWDVDGPVQSAPGGLE